MCAGPELLRRRCAVLGAVLLGAPTVPGDVAARRTVLALVIAAPLVLAAWVLDTDASERMLGTSSREAVDQLVDLGVPEGGSFGEARVY